MWTVENSNDPFIHPFIRLRKEKALFRKNKRQEKKLCCVNTNDDSCKWMDRMLFHKIECGQSLNQQQQQQVVLLAIKVWCGSICLYLVYYYSVRGLYIKQCRHWYFKNWRENNYLLHIDAAKLIWKKDHCIVGGAIFNVVSKNNKYFVHSYLHVRDEQFIAKTTAIVICIFMRWNVFIVVVDPSWYSLLLRKSFLMKTKINKNIDNKSAGGTQY